MMLPETIRPNMLAFVSTMCIALTRIPPGVMVQPRGTTHVTVVTTMIYSLSVIVTSELLNKI